MKRLPDLLKKMKQNPVSIGHRAIGILGVGRGVGATHTGIMLANYTSGMTGQRTAFLEMHENKDFIYLQKAYEGEEEPEKMERFFTIFQVDYYREVEKNEVVSLLNLDYDCFIFDFGCNLKMNQEEFLRCAEKIVICNLTEWKRYELIEFMKEAKTIAGYQSWKYIVALGDKSDALELEKELGISILCMETEENPFALSKNTLKVFQKIF